MSQNFLIFPTVRVWVVVVICRQHELHNNPVY